jgi:EAL domain-containing protein (putative c-di-GMP-specific phosphodiesterase class I)
MRSANKVVRQSLSLPAKIASQVRSLAKRRRVSSNRVLVELIEDGLEAAKQKEKEFFELAEMFRSTTDTEEAKRLGDKLGRMVFGD